MKRNVITLLAAGAALAVAGPVAAQEAGSQAGGLGRGVYGNIQLGIADASGYDSGMVLIATGGKDMSPRTPGGFSVEGEITSTISKPEARAFGQSAELSYYTLGAYGAYTIPVGNELSVRGRLGALYEDYKVDSTVSSKSDWNTSLSFGVGAAYHINKQVSAIAEYTYITKDINHYSAGLQFRF